jgi:Ca2+-binding RTX toxin-like protein
MGRAALTRCSARANTLVGIRGDDLFYVNSIGDVVIEGAGGGIDTVGERFE